MIIKMLLEAGRVIRSNEEDGAKMIIEMVIKNLVLIKEGEVLNLIWVQYLQFGQC